MGNINRAVFDQCIVYIVNWNRNGIRIGKCWGINGFYITQILFQNAGNSLFQNFIYRNLQVIINRKIDVISLFWLNQGSLYRFQLFSDVINDNLFWSVGSLKDCLHILFQTRFSDDGFRGIRFFFSLALQLFIQFCQLVWGRLARITDQRGKILSVIIYTLGIFRNADTLQNIFILCNRCSCIAADAGSNCHADILLIIRLFHLIADHQNFQTLLIGKRKDRISGFVCLVWKTILFKIFGRICVFFIVRIGIQAKAVRSGKKCHQRFGTGTLLFCRHIVDFLLSINICTETVADRSLFTCKNKRTVLIHFNREGAGVNRVSVCTNQLTETIEFCVQRENTFFCRVVRSVILDGYGVGNLISSDQFSVPVINISSCTLKCSGFCDLQFKIIRILFSMHHLQDKKSSDQDGKHSKENHTKQ